MKKSTLHDWRCITDARFVGKQIIGNIRSDKRKMTFLFANILELAKYANILGIVKK